jgi:hypothetical protein
VKCQLLPTGLSTRCAREQLDLIPGDDGREARFYREMPKPPQSLLLPSE